MMCGPNMHNDMAHDRCVPCLKLCKSSKTLDQAICKTDIKCQAVKEMLVKSTTTPEQLTTTTTTAAPTGMSSGWPPSEANVDQTRDNTLPILLGVLGIISVVAICAIIYLLYTKWHKKLLRKRHLRKQQQQQVPNIEEPRFPLEAEPKYPQQETMEETQASTDGDSGYTKSSSTVGEAAASAPPESVPLMTEQPEEDAETMVKEPNWTPRTSRGREVHEAVS